MSAVELFAGAGGLALGVAQAGFEHEHVLEWDADACETLRANQRKGLPHLGDCQIHEGDVRGFDYGVLGDGVDLVAGGPPCQPFSLGGNHRGHLDSRDMFPEAVRAVRELQPRAILIENVKGLGRQKFADYLNYVYLQLTYPGVVRADDEEWPSHLERLELVHTAGEHEGLRYNVLPPKVLNAADFGVPQRRERMFFVGFRSDLHVDWSFERDLRKTHSQDRLLWEQWVTGEYWDRHGIQEGRRPRMPAKLSGRVERLRQLLIPPDEQPWRTVRDAISDLPRPTTAECPGVFNHVHNPGARSYPGHTGSPLDEPSKTIKAGDHGVPGGENMIRHYNGRVRYFTVREAARIQAFPDEYEFTGAWTEAMRQIGNAVPVRLARAVAASIQGRLRELDERNEAPQLRLLG